jgi:potassium-dependent mechanosensitive channel
MTSIPAHHLLELIRVAVKRGLFVLLLLLFLQPGQALSTTTGQSQFLQWSENVKYAEWLLEKQEASIQDMEALRQKLAHQREQALTIVGNGSVRVRTLQAQLEALGPAPTEGAAEPEQIAARRKELQKDIAQASEPLIKAEQVVQQSDVLIKELDSAIRQRTTTALLERDPSPLIVTRWPAAARELGEALAQEKRALQMVIEDPYTKTVLKNRLPLSLFLFLLGLLTITIVRMVVLRSLLRVYAKSEQGKLINWPAILINCTHLGLPGISAGLFVAGFYLLHLDAYILKKTISYLPLIAVVFVVGHWLGQSLFAPKQKKLRPTELEDVQAATGYRSLLLLALTLSLHIILELLKVDYQFSRASEAVLTLPFIILGAAALWLLCSVLQQARHNLLETSADEDTESTIAGSLLLTVSIFLKTAALLSTLFIILGFTSLAREILAPMIVTVALLGLSFFIFQILTSLLEPLFSRDAETNESGPTLLPILIIVGIIISVLPLLALTWGMRWTTIVEIWWTLNEGVQLGNTTISLEIILLLAVVFAFGVGLTRWLQKVFRVAILPRTKLDIGGQNALITGIGYTGITLSALIAISSAGLDLSSLAILAGALSVGIGFGLQTIASNFVSGIILLVERPIKEGDWIEVSGYSGYVRKISVRSTRIETFDRHDVIVPNANLVAEVVKNMTLTGLTGRIILAVGVAYGTDAEEVKQLLLEIAAGHLMILKYPAPTVLFIGLGASSIDFELRCFVRDVNNMLTVQSDLYFSIYSSLNEAGIEIPFPQRVVTMKKSE